MLADLIPPLAIGFFGSLHCLGMCGPLVIACSLPRGSANPCEGSGAPRAAVGPRPPGMLHHAAFHLGRLLCYGILGALAAGLFHAADLSRLFFKVRVNMHLVAGSLLILCGSLLMRIIPLPANISKLPALSGSVLGRTAGRFIPSRGIASKAGLGFCVGFLPCCLSWGMLLTAASTMDLGSGFLVMAAFGLGTVPALACAGIICRYLTPGTRAMGEPLAGLSVAIMGLVLILRGMGIIS